MDGTPGRGVGALKEAIRLEPDYSEAYFEAGNILRRLGRLDEAEAIFRHWSQVMPGNAQARLELGGAVLDRAGPRMPKILFAAALSCRLRKLIRGSLHHNLPWRLPAGSATRKRWNTCQGQDAQSRYGAQRRDPGRDFARGGTL